MRNSNVTAPQSMCWSAVRQDENSDVLDANGQNRGKLQE